MKLSSSNSPIYLPEKNQTSVLRLGLQNIAKEDWIYTDDDLPIFHQHKTALRHKHDEKCFQALAKSEAAQEELHDFLLDHLAGKAGSSYRLNGASLHNSKLKLGWQIADKNLWQASLWVAEDMCLLEKVSDEYILTAASVCSPSNWKLEEKIGASIDSIHGPVPAYHNVLSERVRRLMDGLKPTKPMLRFNWSIQNGNELYWRSELDEGTGSAEKYWRIERQTLLRLPQTGAIVFGIRIFLHSFEAMNKLDGFQNSLVRILKQLPAREKAYKGLL